MNACILWKNVIKANFFTILISLSFCVHHGYLYILIIEDCHCFFLKQSYLYNGVLYTFSPLEFTHNGSINRNNLPKSQVAILRCAKYVVLSVPL